MTDASPVIFATFASLVIIETGTYLLWTTPPFSLFSNIISSVIVVMTIKRGLKHRRLRKCHHTPQRFLC
jgi:hypothetical protein